MSDNILKASDGITADGTQYILAKQNSTVGFYKASIGSAITAGKGYIEIAGLNNVKVFYLEEGATSLGEELRVNNEESDTNVYDLSGRTVNGLKKGFYIVNGKKILF